MPQWTVEEMRFLTDLFERQPGVSYADAAAALRHSGIGQGQHESGGVEAQLNALHVYHSTGPGGTFNLSRRLRDHYTEYPDETRCPICRTRF